MTRKSIFWIGGIVLMIVMLGLFFMNHVSEDTKLAHYIVEQAKSGKTEIPLAVMTDFEWEKAAVYGPYTTADIIEESLDIKFKGSTNGIESRDDIFLLVFAKGNHAVKTAKLSRFGGYDYEQNGMLTPKDDLLIIVKH